MSTDLIFLAVLILLSGLFSGSETALISLSPSKVDELVEQKRKNSKLLKMLKKDPHRLMITVLIGNNIVNILASAYAAVIFTEMFADSGVGIATGVMTFLILVFGEITPKAFAHENAVMIALIVAKPVRFLQIVLWPLVWFFEKIVDLVNRIMGVEKEYTVTEGELVAMLKIGAKEGSIEKHEKEFIENVLDFNDIKVEEVMTPRVDIDALNIEMTLGEAIDFAIQHPHSRLPVCDGGLDNIVGVLTIKNLLKLYRDYSGSKKLANVKIPTPLEVPFSKTINAVFKDFQMQRVHMAIVIDEFGGTAGLITMEDVLEEIVGDIHDETDLVERPFEVVNSKTILVSGDLEMEVINDFFRQEFGENDHDTVNSLVTEKLQRFPRVDEVVKFDRGTVKILEVEGNVVKKARIRIKN